MGARGTHLSSPQPPGEPGFGGPRLPHKKTHRSDLGGLIPATFPKGGERPEIPTGRRLSPTKAEAPVSSDASTDFEIPVRANRGDGENPTKKGGKNLHLMPGPWICFLDLLGNQSTPGGDKASGPVRAVKER